MQNENSRLKIHTNVRPAVPDEAKETAQENETRQTEERRQPLPARGRESKRLRGSEGKKKDQADRQTVGERMMRNTAVACALLLTVMAIRNVDQPWSEKAEEGIRQVMTMRVDWDETLGKLSFVRALVPDTALVFLNMGGGQDLSTPVSGTVTHEFTGQQPWLEYRCPAGQTVCAALSGTVTAAGRGAGNDWTVLIESEEGDETVYGYLQEVYVQAGQQVEAGEVLGITENKADSRLYFEFREDGQAADPSGRMK